MATGEGEGEASSTPEKLVVWELVIANEGAAPREAQVVEIAWALVDVPSKSMLESQSQLVRPQRELPEDFLKTWTGTHLNAEKLEAEGVELEAALATLDQLVFAHQAAGVGLAAFGASRLLRYLRNFAAEQGVALQEHWGKCFDLGREFGLVHDVPSASLSQLAQQYGLAVPVPRAGLALVELLGTVVAALLESASPGVVFQPSAEVVVGDGAVDLDLPPVGLHPADARYGAIVRLRGLPWSTTAEEVQEFLGSELVAEAADVTLVIARDGRASGEAYVRLLTLEALEKAKEKDHQEIGSRYVEVLQTSEADFESYLRRARQRLADAQRQQQAKAVVRLRGLPWDATVQAIQQFMAPVAAVGADAVVIGVQDGRPSGTAWVSLAEEEVAQQALADLDRQPLGARYVEVFASSAGEMQAARAAANARGSARAGARGFKGGAVAAVPWSSHTGQAHVDSVLRLRGLPFTATEYEIVQLFQGFAMLAVLPSTAPTNGRPSGQAYVEFTTALEAARAYEACNGAKIGQRYIELFFATQAEMMAAAAGNDARTAAQIAQTGRGYAPAWPQPVVGAKGKGKGQGKGKGKGRSGVAAAYSAACIVHCRGLPWTLTTEDLQGFFAGYALAAGSGDALELVVRADGRPSGEAYVAFATPEVAAEAVHHLHRQNLGHRYVELYPMER